MTTEQVGETPRAYILLPFEELAVALSVVCGYDSGEATFGEARAAVLTVKDLLIAAMDANLMGFADELWLAEHLALSARVYEEKTNGAALEAAERSL